MTEAGQIRTVQLRLDAFRMIATRLGRAIEALRDTKGFAGSVNANDWYASRIAEHEEALKTEIMPEVDAAIKQLEAEIRP